MVKSVKRKNINVEKEENLKYSKIMWSVENFVISEILICIEDKRKSTLSTFSD